MTARLERRLAGQVHRIRVGPEIVIVRNVLLENDDQMPDRRRSMNAAIVAVSIAVTRQHGRGRDHERYRETARNDWMFHLLLPRFEAHSGTEPLISRAGRYGLYVTAT